MDASRELCYALTMYIFIFIIISIIVPACLIYKVKSSHCGMLGVLSIIDIALYVLGIYAMGSAKCRAMEYIPDIFYICLVVFILFMPSYSYIEAKQTISNVIQKKRIAFYGFVFGLMTPAIVLLILFVPVIYNSLGINEESYSKSALELANNKVYTYLYCSAPMSIYGATIFVLYSTIHKVFFFIYNAIISPLWKDIKTWFFDVFRY